jgi:response regulator RpfG family c-di-GMP phosphodiesterase
MSKTARILCVDDDTNALSAYQRTLRKIGLIDVVNSGAAALVKLAEELPYAVIISDRNMPGMDGIELLIQAQQVAPDTVRIMLTGDDQQATAISAVNEGHIFRFLNKPCNGDDLIKATELAIQQYHLITAEKELLEKTLAGAIGVMTEILSLIDDQSFGRVYQVRKRMSLVAAALKIPDAWALDIAVMLGGIGRVTVPREILIKGASGRPLSADEKDMIERIPETGSMLIANIPRLDVVSHIVLYQRKRWDGSGFPANSVSGEAIPIGARLIRILEDLAEIEATGASALAASVVLKQRKGMYDITLLDRVVAVIPVDPHAKSSEFAVRLVPLTQLKIGMVLRADVLTKDGTVLIASGHAITPMLQERLDNFSRLVGITEPLLVEPPLAVKT